MFFALLAGIGVAVFVGEVRISRTPSEPKRSHIKSFQIVRAHRRLKYDFFLRSSIKICAFYNPKDDKDDKDDNGDYRDRNFWQATLRKEHRGVGYPSSLTKRYSFSRRATGRRISVRGSHQTLRGRAVRLFRGAAGR